MGEMCVPMSFPHSQRMMTEEDMSPTYNTLLSVPVAVSKFPLGAFKRPVDPIVIDDDSGMPAHPDRLRARFDALRLRNPGDLVVAVLMSTSKLLMMTPEMAVTAMAALAQGASWWHICLAYQVIATSEVKVPMSKKLRKTMVKVCAHGGYRAFGSGCGCASISCEWCRCPA